MMTGRGIRSRETETIFAVLALQSILPFPHDFFCSKSHDETQGSPSPSSLSRSSLLPNLPTHHFLSLPPSFLIRHQISFNLNSAFLSRQTGTPFPDTPHGESTVDDEMDHTGKHHHHDLVGWAAVDLVDWIRARRETIG